MTRRLLIPLALAVVPAACGDPAYVESEMTREEATSFLEGILALREMGGLTLIEGSGSVAEFACPLDGRVTFLNTGYEREVADTLWIDEGETVIPDRCGFASDGLEFQMVGRPNLVNEVAREVVGWRGVVRAASGSLKGGVVWQLGGRTGDCAMDLTLSLEPGNGNAGVYKGNVCGHEGVEVGTSLGVILLSG